MCGRLWTLREEGCVFIMAVKSFQNGHQEGIGAASSLDVRIRNGSLFLCPHPWRLKRELYVPC